jgi:hypothetical protein
VYVTTSRGPERAHSTSFGAAPLFFYSEAFGRNGRLEREHLIIPPLLTFHRWWPTGQTTIAGPFVYVRNRSTVDWAFGPLVINHSGTDVSWTVIPPLLTFRRYDHSLNRSLTLVGPVWTESWPDGGTFNFAPLFFHAHDRNGARTTFLPFFHTEQGPNRFSFFTALGGYARNGGETTLVTPFYQNHRGATQLDAVTPFAYVYRDPRRGATVTAVPLPLPIVHSQSPTGNAWGVFPFILRAHEYGRYETTATPLFVHSNVTATNSTVTWVFPTFHRETAPTYSVFNFYPLVYSARGSGWYHTVVAPFFASIGNRNTGQQITLSLFYGRVSTPTTYTQWVFPNVITFGQTRAGSNSWGVDVAPFVQWGSPRTGDAYWSVFYGLVGYRRQGSYEQLRLFYIPINLRGTPPSSGSGSGSSSGSAQARSDNVRLEL